MKTNASAPSLVTTLGFALAAALFSAGAAVAQEVGVGPIPDTAEERFGDIGQLFISSAFQFDITYTTPDNQPNSTRLVLAPWVGYFVVPDLAVGGTVRLEHDTGASSTSFGISPFLGYNFWIADLASVMPTLSFGYTYLSFPSAGMEVSGYRFNGQVDLPVLFHPVPHLFVGLSPFARVDLVARLEGKEANKTHQFGLGFIIGGWL